MTEQVKPRQHAEQDRLGAVTFGGVGRRHHTTQNQPQGVHQQNAACGL